MALGVDHDLAEARGLVCVRFGRVH
jgi:hypothetical protein